MKPRPSPYEIMVERRKRAQGLPYDPVVARMVVARKGIGQYRYRFQASGARRRKLKALTQTN